MGTEQSSTRVKVEAVPSDHAQSPITYSSLTTSKSYRQAVKGEAAAKVMFFQSLERRQYLYEMRHRQHLSERLPGTCEWIFVTEEFLSWLSKARHTICLVGGAGCGKTVLASQVIRLLSDLRKDVVYFHLDKGSTSFLDMVASLLTQLWFLYPGRTRPLPHLARQYPRWKKIPQRLSWIRRAFTDLVDLFKLSPFVILDAWDEENMDKVCMYQAFLAFLKERKFQVMLTCRHLGDNIIGNEDVTLKIPCQLQAPDLDILITSLTTLDTARPASTLITSDTTLASSIKDSVRQFNCFAKIRMFVDLLMLQPTRHRIVIALSSMDTFQLLHEVTLPSQQNLLNTTIRWLSEAQRPLTCLALAEALALLSIDGDITPSRPAPALAKFPNTSDCPTTNTILTCGRGLLWRDHATDAITLQQKGPWYFRLCGPYSLGDACLACLTIEAFGHMNYRSFRIVSEYAVEHPFLAYAACEWLGLAISEHMQPRYWCLVKSTETLRRILALKAVCDYPRQSAASWNIRLSKLERVTTMHILIMRGDVRGLDTWVDTWLEQADEVGGAQMMQELHDITKYAAAQGARECCDVLRRCLVDFVRKVDHPADVLEPPEEVEHPWDPDLPIDSIE